MKRKHKYRGKSAVPERRLVETERNDAEGWVRLQVEQWNGKAWVPIGKAFRTRTGGAMPVAAS